MPYPEVGWPLPTWERDQEPTVKSLPIAFHCDWCNGPVYAYDTYYESPAGDKICAKCWDEVCSWREKEADWPEGCEYDG